MASPILKNGDTAQLPTQMNGGAKVTYLAPLTLTGTGKVKVMGKNVCTKTDIAKFKVPCTYERAAFKAGTGTVRIEASTLQLTTKSVCAGIEMVLIQGNYTAILEEQVLAMTTSAPPQPDAIPIDQGMGTFKTPDNQKIKGT